MARAPRGQFITSKVSQAVDVFCRQALRALKLAFDTLEGRVETLEEPPAVALRGTTQTIPNSPTITTLVLGTEGFDSGMHSGTDGFFTVQTGEGGLWLVAAGCNWAANATGIRDILIVLANNSTNGEGNNTYHAGHAVTNSGNNGNSLTKLMKLEAGATVTARVFQSSGGDLDVSQSYLTAVLIRRDPTLT